MIKEIVLNWWHIPVLMVAIFVYAWLLNRWFFQPVLRVLDERKRLEVDAAELSVHSRDELKVRMEEYEDAVLEAHRRGAKIKEAARSQANQLRSSILGGIKGEIAASLKEEGAKLERNVEEVKTELDNAIPAFARTLAERVLGRDVAP